MNALIHRVVVANPSFWTEGVGEISYINQKNSSKLCFGVRIQKGDENIFKKILTSDYCILYSRYLAALPRGSSFQTLMMSYGEI